MNSAQALDRLRQELRRRHHSPATEATYCGWLRRYIAFLREHPADLPREQRVEKFLTALAHERRSASSQNQALSALVFFHVHVLERPLVGVNALRARRPDRVRVAPDRAQTHALLASLPAAPPIDLVARLLYGCGLRLNEALNLRLKDVDPARMRLWIRDAKHRQDRVVALPTSLADALRAQIATAEAAGREDFRGRIPVPLPGLIARKHPHAEYHRDWRWLFPAAGTCRDDRSGRIVRWRLHEINVQRAFAHASDRLGMRPAITPHHLRHAYATHCLEAGVNVRALQAAMGHKSLETTMGYLHADALAVVSPLDRMGPPPPHPDSSRTPPRFPSGVHP